MRHLSLAIVVALVCAAPPALAQDQVVGQTPDEAQNESLIHPQGGTQPKVQPRYSFDRAGDGYLRLDHDSGQMSICRSQSVGWTCQVVPEDRAALDKEIARLQDEVANLRQEVAALRAPPRPPAELTKPDLAPPPAGKSDDAVRLREDIEHARVAIEHAWRRLVEMIVNFQKDMMRKG